VSWLLAFAIALTRSWTATYTRGLPADVRAERREEIGCDLWHQQRLAELEREPVTGTATQILVRVALGMPADLLWRIEAGSTTQTTITRRNLVNDTWPMRLGLLVATLPLLILVINGVGIAFFGAGDFNNSTEHVLWGLAFLVCPLVTLIGVWLCRNHPRLGLGMVIVGVAASVLVMFWMAFIVVPIGLLLIAYSYKRSRGAREADGGGPPRPAPSASSSRWKKLLAVIGLSVASLVGIALYAFSLEEWGNTRAILFNVGGMSAISVGLYAFVLLLSDLWKGRRPQSSV
jgi:hypothetical protein